MTDNTDNVTYLKSHSEQLSRRLQQLLDRQWDGLSSHKGRWIVSAREGIDQTMNELLETQTALAELYQAQISSRRAWLERTKLIQDKITALSNHINNIENEGEVASEIQVLEKEQTGINEEIAALQFKLKQLYSRKQEIATRLVHLKSTVESKTSSFKHELASLEKQNEPQPENKLETYTREVDAIKGQQDDAEHEIVALKDGLVVWRDVCMTINELESSLKESISDSNLVLDNLKRAKEKLDSSMEIAKSSNWSLLTVAISHEIEALNEGMQLVTKYK